MTRIAADCLSKSVTAIVNASLIVATINAAPTSKLICRSETDRRYPGTLPRFTQRLFNTALGGEGKQASVAFFPSIVWRYKCVHRLKREQRITEKSER